MWKGLIKIRKHDEWTSREELNEALTQNTSIVSSDLRIVSLRKRLKIIRKNGYKGLRKRSSQSTLVLVPMQVAKKLVVTSRVLVELMNCHESFTRRTIDFFCAWRWCFSSKDCLKPVRNSCCSKCDVESHFAATCSNSINVARIHADIISRESNRKTGNTSANMKGNSKPCSKNLNGP